MEWEKLLTLKTREDRNKLPKEFDDYATGDVENDYEQIISSSAFRRLQDKTQVFPLDKSDFVRTRLTHSIEVSTIARQLGVMVTAGKKTYCKDELGQYNTEIPAILSCAGLLHDIGNPPFGHFGEVIIGDWFKNKFAEDGLKFNNKSIKEILNDQMKGDLENFEGNAQALRILTKSNYGRDNVNLSFSVLNTLIKYPTKSIEFSSVDNDIKKHKLGYYYSENGIVDDICEETGTKINGEYFRHPLTFLLEAADDIAYSTADLEDALKKGLFTLDEFVFYFSSEIESFKKDKINNTHHIKYSEDILKNLKSDIENIKERNKEIDFNIFQKWLGDVKKWLMYVVVYGFSNKNNYKEIKNGTFKKDLFWNTNHFYTIKILKGAMRKFVFNNTEILKLELSAKKIIESFLNDFIGAVIYWEEENLSEKMSKSDNKYVNLIPQNLRDEYIKSKPKNKQERLYMKFMMVTDFISGMTDSYAKNLYQELYGIR